MSRFSVSDVWAAALARPRRVFAGIALLCLGMLLFGVLYLQHTLGLDPCPMCIVQRYALIAVGLLAALAAVSRTRKAWWTWGGLAVAAGLFGAFTAARQSWLQWNPPPFPACGRDFYGMVESFPLKKAIPMIFQGSGDCSAVDWTFLGGTIANWSFVWFSIFVVLILTLLLRKPPAQAAAQSPAA